MQFSDENLIAFLLGDASEDLSRQIQQQLATDARLLGRLSHFRMVLGQIDSWAGVYEPPADLVDATLARIDQFVDSTQQVEFAAQPVQLAVKSEALARRGSIWDSTVLTACLTILCCLALPALVRVRFESRRAQCARNLRITGAELINYALSNPEQRFPFVRNEGPEAFAGVYAVYLRESGASISPHQLHCASLLGCEDASDSLRMQSIPTFAQLRRLAVQELSLWQKVIGGDYAYNLGVQEQGNPRAPKCEGRSQFAILADAPVIVGNQAQFNAHDGRGINIFYEDGRVAFVSTRDFFSMPNIVSRSPAESFWDDPFRNQLGVHEVGLHAQDASLAPSRFPPLGTAR